MVKDHPTLARFFDGVVPVIFEQHGCPSQCAVTFLYHVLRRRVAKLEQSSHLTHGVAWMIAARELYAPISCILLVLRHPMFQECSPIVQRRTDLGSYHMSPAQFGRRTTELHLLEGVYRLYDSVVRDCKVCKETKPALPRSRFARVRAKVTI